jgi:hypothetical protein
MVRFSLKDLLPPLQNVVRFNFSRFIVKYMNLEKSKQPTFWNGWIGRFFIIVTTKLNKNVTSEKLGAI